MTGIFIYLITLFLSATSAKEGNKIEVFGDILYKGKNLAKDSRYDIGQIASQNSSKIPIIPERNRSHMRRSRTSASYFLRDARVLREIIISASKPNS